MLSLIENDKGRTTCIISEKKQQLVCNEVKITQQCNELKKGYIELKK